MKTALLIALWLIAAAFILFWVRDIVRRKDQGPRTGPLDAAIGFFANFFDTLGIGSFATTSSLFKLGGLVRDEQIPGTLNVGNALPTVTEALIFIAVVQVDVTTLVLMIAASVLGAWLGAGVVSHWPRRKIQIGMGILLLAAAVIMVIRQFSPPAGGGSLGVTGMQLAIAVVVNGLLGALMTLGIGLFAPCMLLVAMLGMNLRAAYPIMMGSCAFLMPVGSVRFVRSGTYNLKSALGLALGGVPGVLVAAYVVKELPLDKVKLLVIAVLIYTSAMLLRSAWKEGAAAVAPRVPEGDGDRELTGKSEL